MRHLSPTSVIASILTLGVVGVASGTDVPSQVAVTMENAVDLGFSVEEIDEGDAMERMVILRFPAKLPERKTAARVQTVLVNEDGEPISITSSDYEVGTALDADGPRVLATYPDDFDLSFSVHYLCKKKNVEDSICETYRIRSINRFLKKKPAETRTPHNKPMQTDEPWPSPSRPPLSSMLRPSASA